MKRYFIAFGAILVLALFSLFASTEEVKAYLKDGCYAAEFKLSGTKIIMKDIVEEGTKVYATQMVCKTNDDKIDLKWSPPSGRDQIKYPDFNGLGNEKITVEYCENGPGGGRGQDDFECEGKKEKEFKRSDYASFEEFVNALDSFVNSMGGDEKVQKLAIDDNNAQDETELTDSAGNAFGEDSSACKDASKSLGWIICPIIEGIAEDANNIYTNWIAPALHVEPKLFDSSGSSSGLRAGWETFRNFANIIFVIFLLFVIFSQVTGVGIDNYGIKKILPKLIIAAVLINLSYVLCVLAVDISNILGNAFQALFETLGKQLNSATSDSPTTLREIGVTGGSLVGLGVLALIISNPTIIGLIATMIIPLLVSAICLIMSIMFLFILLAAREAAILVLIVLAPIAIVCYALPNTKSYFSKWLKFFGSLLMVYPIAGLLVGGGNYASALILATGGGDSFFTAFTAMITGVVPIFFIPAVLKGSLSMAGNIGSKISDFGRGAGARLGRASGTALENNERFANWQREKARSAQLYSVGRTKSRVNRKTNRLASRYTADFLADGKSQEEAEALARAKAEGELSGGDSRALARATLAEKNAKTEDIQSYMALINDQTNYGADKEGLANLAKGYASSGNKEAVLAAGKIAGRRKDTAADFMNNVLKTQDLGADMKASLSKEIAEGETAANYRAADAFGFQYASDINSGETSAGYNKWKEGAGNLDKALKAHVTNTDELMSQQGSALNEIADAINDGLVSSEHATRIQGLAKSRISTKDTLSGYDTTKDAQMQRLAAGASRTDTNIGGPGGLDSVSE